jgi:hypothetical protein
MHSVRDEPNRACLLRIRKRHQSPGILHMRDTPLGSIGIDTAVPSPGDLLQREKRGIHFQSQYLREARQNLPVARKWRLELIFDFQFGEKPQMYPLRYTEDFSPC